MDTVYPAGASALARGRRLHLRLRRGPQRARTRTQPVTFAEIKEVDEEISDEGGACAGCGGGEERRRGARDELAVTEAEAEAGGWRRDPLALETPAPPLQRQFVESRRRRARRDVIPEPPEESGQARAASEPRAQGSP